MSFDGYVIGQKRLVGTLRNPFIFEHEAVLCGTLHGKVAIPAGQEPENATKLHYAAVNGDLSLVKALVRRGYNVNAKDGDGGTPLHIAICLGRAEIARYLIKEGADVNDAQGERGSLLVCASETKSLEVVKMLVDAGADVNVGMTTRSGTDLPLAHRIAMHSTPDILSFLLSRGLNVNITCSIQDIVTDFTPLHSAAESGNAEVLKILIAKGLNVNARDSRGRTPLHLAAFRGRLEAAKILIRKSADVNAETDQRWTPLHFSVKEGCLAMAEIMLKKGAGIDSKVNYLKMTPIQVAAAFRENCMAQHLLNSGADVLSKDVFNKTLLHYAVGGLSVDLVHRIILKGADVNCKRLDHVTPVHLAVAHNRPDVLKLLLDNGAFFNSVPEKDCPSPIDLAKKLGFKEVIKVLELAEEMFDSVISADCTRLKRCLGNGGIVNVKNLDGRTPLHYAITKGNLKATKLLLSKQADITSVTNKGNTLLHLAVSHDNAEILKLLLQRAKKLDLETRNDFINAKTSGKSMTALHVGALKNNFSAVKLLLEHGAVYCPKNVDGETPLRLTTDEPINNLLKLIDELFLDAKKGNTYLDEKVKSLESGTFSVVSSARNERMQNLFEVLRENKHEWIAGRYAETLMHELSGGFFNCTVHAVNF